MGNIKAFFRERLVDISTKRIYIAPNIEEKKLNNAIGAFGYAGRPGNVVAVCDDTLLGNAKEGLLFTGEQVIYRPPMGKAPRGDIIGFLLRGNMVAWVRFGCISLTETKALIAAGSLDHDAVDEYLDAKYARLLRA